MPSVSARPLVSILVCIYNGEKFLSEALGSVWAQTWPDYELIAVDDGSTDGSAALLHACRDPRLRVLRQQNLGAARALAVGLGQAQGELVAFLDQDDQWTGDSLATHVGLLQRRSTIDLTFSAFRFVDHAARGIGLRRRHYRGTLEFNELLADFAIGATSNVVVRRAAIERAGGVDSAFLRMYDLDLFLRIALLRPANVEAIPAELMLYRRHGAQISYDYEALIGEWEQVLAKFLRLAPAAAATVQNRARMNSSRYFARLAYENGDFRRASQLLMRGFRASPLHFLAEPRNWSTGAACLAGRMLPPTQHWALERLAGLRRPIR